MTPAKLGRTVTVWHVFGAMDVGGAELRTLELATAMMPLGIRFDYVTLSGRQGVLADRVHESGSRIYQLALAPAFPLRFVMAMRQHRPDVVDSHVATFSGFLLFLAWLARVPIRIAHFRSDGDGHVGTWPRRLQRRVMRWLIKRFATDIVGVSPSALSLGYREDWRTDGRARVVPNGLGPPREPPRGLLREHLRLSENSLVLMHVGRPSPEKNRPQTVSVLAAMREAGEDAHLVLVGPTGADEAKMRERSEFLGVTPHIHSLGSRDDVRSLMSQADVLLLTSIREGLPGVVLESLSVGTPVVSVGLPGVQYIASAVPGVVIVGSDPDEWVSSIRLARRVFSPDQRPQIRRAFLNGPFSLEQSCRAHASIYTRGGRGR